MASLLDRFRDHLQRARLLARPGTAIVAVSGGSDSVALLDLLQAVAAERGLALVVAHADHGIQEASGDVGKWVGGLAARYGLPFELGELNLGPNATETVARRARYAWLREVQRRRAARYLVTAHHQDDQVETVMLRVLRGSAPAGLAGIPARARGRLVRPLLAFTRAQLAAHVAAQRLTVHEDPANRDPRHLRSWVRLELLPLIERRLGAASRADLLRLARTAARGARARARAHPPPRAARERRVGAPRPARRGVDRRGRVRRASGIPRRRLRGGAGRGDGRARRRRVRRVPPRVAPRGGPGAGGAGGVDDVDRGQRVAAARPACRGPRVAAGRRGPPSPAALTDGSARAAERAGGLPHRRPRRNDSVGARRVSQRGRSAGARNPSGAPRCYQGRRASVGRRVGASWPAWCSTSRRSPAAWRSSAATSRPPTPRGSCSCSGCSREVSSSSATWCGASTGRCRSTS